MAAEEPVAVETHIPEDQTLRLFWTSKGRPPKRVMVPYWLRGRSCGSLILLASCMEGLEEEAEDDKEEREDVNPDPPPSLNGLFGSKSTSFSHPMRNRLTAAGLGLAMSISFSAGTRRVSEKVDLTMHCIRARVVSFPPPKRTWGTLVFMSRAVIAQSAPWDLFADGGN